MDERRPPPFRWILPITQLILCAALMWPWRGFFILQMRSTGHEFWPNRIPQPVYYVNVPPNSGRTTASLAEKIAMMRPLAPALLNFPCILLGPIDAVPPWMLPDFWRSITWPFFGIIFWWIAGRGIEVLIASRRRSLARRITWVEVIVASIIIALCTLLCVGFASDKSFRSDFIYPWSAAAVASGLWIVLASTTMVARVVQWRIRRDLARSKQV